MGRYNSNPDYQSAPRSPTRMHPSDSNALMRPLRTEPEEIDSENEDYWGDTIDLNNEPKRRRASAYSPLREGYRDRARSFDTQQRSYPRPKARSYSYDDRSSSYYSHPGYSHVRPHFVYENVNHFKPNGRAQTQYYSSSRMEDEMDRDSIKREIREFRMSMMEDNECGSTRIDRTCCLVADRAAQNWIDRRRRHFRARESEQIQRDLDATIAEINEWRWGGSRGRRR